MKKRLAVMVCFCLLELGGVCYAQPQATSAPAPEDSDIDYCRAFASIAREARFAHQKQELMNLKTDIETQLAVLTAKTEELKSWVEKRDRIKAGVSESLVKVYANMEAETAAAQLQKLEPEMASVLLQQLNSKQAGEIMSAMEPNLAGRITRAMLVISHKANGEKQQQ